MDHASPGAPWAEMEWSGTDSIWTLTSGEPASDSLLIARFENQIPSLR